MASSTLARIAKKASAFTIHVEPNRSEKLTRLFVSRRRKATPRTKKCGLKVGRTGPVRRLTSQTPATETASRNPSVAREKREMNGTRRGRHGQSSVAVVGGGDPARGGG